MLAAIVTVGCGGFIGAALRYCVQSMPLFDGIGYAATFTVNIAGSFIIGAAWIILSNFFPTDSGVYTFAVPGILGGFTTYSSFSLDFVKLMQAGTLLPEHIAWLHWQAVLRPVCLECMLLRVF